MASVVVPEPCQARRGLDYATAVFVSATQRHQQGVFDFCRALGDEISTSMGWEESPRSLHFDAVFQSTTGMRIELTPVDGGGERNRGITVLSLPGSYFYLLNTEQAMFSLRRIVEQSGFKWFTRLDLMNTELNPEWDAMRVLLSTQAGETWVKGYSSWRPYGSFEFDGSCDNGVTLYWGSPRSERQGRTYDKGAQLRWPTPAIRDEVQLRGEWAHAYGREIAQAVKRNVTTDQMNDAVSDITTAALNQHLQYWTLNGADPKHDKNWQRKAEPAQWFRDRIGAKSMPIRRAPRNPLDEEAALNMAVHSYGATIGKYLLRQGIRSDGDLFRALIGFGGRCIARVKPDDLLDCLGVTDPDAAERLLAEYGALLDQVAREAEMVRGDTE